FVCVSAIVLGGLALVPAAPLVLESQGFYSRPVVSSRTTVFWPLLKSCFIVTIGVVLLLFIVAAILILIGRAQGLRVKGPERSIEQVEQTKAALESFVPDIPMPAPPSGRQIGAQRSGAPGSS
ncbi:MAG: hypothetical protein WCI74_06865, partial [Actinomycetes bacterium]